MQGQMSPADTWGVEGASPRAGLPPGCRRGSTYQSSGSADCRQPSRATWEAAPKAPRRGASSMNPHGALCWSGHDITLRESEEHMSKSPIGPGARATTHTASVERTNTPSTNRCACRGAPGRLQASVLPASAQTHRSLRF